MPRKLLTSLPTILTVGVAVIPAVAQAAPHYYKSGVRIPGGEWAPILEWGTLRLSLEPPLTWSISCETVSGGYVENPVDRRNA